MYNEENYTVLRSLVAVLNLQRDLVVMRFIHIGLMMCSTSKVDRVNGTYTFLRDVL